MVTVSVILPNYNHAPFLKQRLDSILNQTYQDFELIILDDCSTDNSREIIEKYSSHPKVSQVIYNETNSGSTFIQWDKGIRIAKGEFIWIAESDDYCEPDFLKTLINKLIKYEKAGIAYCQSVSVNEANDEKKSWIEHTAIFDPNVWYNNFYINGLDVIEQCFLYSNIIPNASAAIFRKSVFEKTSGFEISMKLNGDWLFWIRMLEKSDLLFLNESLNFFRQHENKVTSVNIKNYNNLVELCRLFEYFDQTGKLSRLQKSRMIKKTIRGLVLQMIKDNLSNSIRKSPKVIKALFKFEPCFLLYLVPASFEYFRNRYHRFMGRARYPYVKLDQSKFKLI